MGWPFRFGTPAFAYDEQDGVWATQLGPNEVKAFSVETLVGNDRPANRVDMAPGDEDPEAIGYRFTYSGTSPAWLYISTATSGGLTTCSGGGKFTVSIVDENGKVYADNRANQPAGRLRPGEGATFRVIRRFDRAAGNDCQNQTGIFSIQGEVIEETGGGTPPQNPPPAFSGPASDRGSILVRAVNGSPDAGGATIPGAMVSLSDGRSGQTDESGTIIFAGLELGTYQVQVSAEDPKNPGPNSRRSGEGSVTLTAEDRDVVLTIILVWDSPAAPPSTLHPPAAPPPATPQPPVAPPAPPPTPKPTLGSVRVRVVDGSSRTRGLPVPIPGAVVGLKGGLEARTDPSGEVLFDGLAVGTYEVWARAVDPQNPGASEQKSAFASVAVTEENPHATVTIVLAWEKPAAPPTQGGDLLGRICAPAAPGAEVTATGPNGAKISLFLAADGSLGLWRPYRLTNLAPGDYEVTLKAPGIPAVRQPVTVKPGETVEVPDLTLACTGGAAPAPNLWPYGIGAALIVTGLALRRGGKQGVRRRARRI